MEARRIDFTLRYNKSDITADIGRDVLNLSYTDCAATTSDSFSVEIDAQDDKWRGSWMPSEGATLWPRVTGRNWNSQGDRHTLDCGLFVLDDLQFADTPSTLQIGGVARPSDTSFSGLEREQVWKNTSIKRIGQTIAGRYGLGFEYRADDYSIECWEQDGTDSKEYNELCQHYGLIMKVYSKKLWVYDREAFKRKAAILTVHRTDPIRGSFKWKRGIADTFTGGYFSYTDADKDCDITASIGGGPRTKSINRYASSVADAAVQLVAELNNANHGSVKASFKLPGCWGIASGVNINLKGFGGAIDGKYFVDKVTHSISRGGGFTSAVECSLCTTPFYASNVGGSIVYNEQKPDASDSYTSTYATTAASDAASNAAGATAGAAVTLTNAPFYVASTSASPACYKSGTFYFYDGILIAGRYRITNLASRCGKLPVGQNVTGWVPASYCGGGGGR